MTATEVVAFSPDNRYLVISFSGRSQIWKLDDIPSRWVTLPGQAREVQFTSDMKRLVTLSPAYGSSSDGFSWSEEYWKNPDGILRIWRLDHLAALHPDGDPKPVATVLRVRRFRISPNNKKFATIGSDGTIQLWNLKQHEIQRVEDGLFGNDQGILTFEFSNDNRYLITDANSQFFSANYSQPTVARIWDLENPLTPSTLTASRPHGRVFTICDSVLTIVG